VKDPEENKILFFNEIPVNGVQYNIRLIINNNDANNNNNLDSSTSGQLSLSVKASSPNFSLIFQEVKLWVENRDN
jgi:hypothetical protein